MPATGLVVGAGYTEALLLFKVVEQCVGGTPQPSEHLHECASRRPASIFAEVVSRIQCERTSMPQCPRMSNSRSAPSAAFGASLVIPYVTVYL